jgi:hypothetical protein
MARIVSVGITHSAAIKPHLVVGRRKVWHAQVVAITHDGSKIGREVAPIATTVLTVHSVVLATHVVSYFVDKTVITSGATSFDDC